MINDELLNKYIDNELTDVELAEFKKEIQTDAEAQNKLKALKLTDEILNKMEVNRAPVNFTEMFMKKIITVSSFHKEKVSYFFVSIISFFVLTITGILGYSISKIESGSSSIAEKNQYVQKTKEVLSGGLGELNAILSNDNMLLIGAGLTFVLLISGYFLIENHKNFKEKLNRFSH
ncbi:MAG: hypothetical protein KJ571_14870 [Bacteroidetes bacterium]|nr:hypothetical protein [Bacteroidota bacterium]